MPGQTSLAPNITEALRNALATTRDSRTAEDLIFLECWERNPTPGTADALRAAQIRRANPELAAAIRAELSAKRK
jgi:hypothetical protein